MTNEKVVLITAIAVFMAFGAIAVFAKKAQAESRHEPVDLIINVPEMSGQALGLAASQHNFDWHTTKWQASIGVGYYDTSEAISAGIGKKWGDILINGSVGCDSRCGGGAGVTWRF